MLTKNELADRIAATGAGHRNQVKRILDGLAEVVEEELNKGESITVPGVVKLNWRYTSPRKKGEMYRKGETYIGFGGAETVAEADSKARKQSVTLKASLATALNRIKKDDAVQKKAIKKAKK